MTGLGLPTLNAFTSAATSSMATMAPQPMPLLPGQTFQCNRLQAKLTPSVCSNGGAIVTVDASGKTTKSQTFSAAPFQA